MSKSEFKQHPTFKQRLYVIVFGTETRFGKIFDIVLLWAIVLSVLAVMLESVHKLNPDYGRLLNKLEWVYTILFTIESILATK